MIDPSPDTTQAKPPLGRLIWGGIVFISGFLSPLLIPLVLASGLSTAAKTVISGLLAIGIPELFMIIAAAILGKSGFKYLKSRIFGFLKKYGPPDMVSLTRYRIGLIFFSLPLVIGLVLPYIMDMVPFIKDNLLIIVIFGDIMLLASLFILGGDFWDKLRSLFIHKSRAILITSETEKPGDHAQKDFQE
jgi:hypothetical protein